MRECLTCLVSKPDPCYQSAKSGVCVACCGRFARREKDRRKGRDLQRQAARDKRLAKVAPYPDQEPVTHQYVHESFFTDWCHEMKALLPAQWESL